MGERERGQLMIIVALGLAVFLGFAALAVDLGHAYSERRFAQNAADAAALAASRMVRIDVNTASPMDVHNEIVRVAALNGSAQVASDEFLDVSGNSLGPVASYSGLLSSVAGIRVKASITFNTFFAPILGINSMTATAASTAMSMGVASADGLGIRPIAVPNQTFNTGSTYTIWDSSMEAPGNAGWLSLDCSNAEQDLGNKLANGYNGPWCNFGSGGTPGSQQTSGSLTFPAWLKGDPGLKNGVKGDVTGLIGQDITILVYDSLTGNGSNTEYHIIRLAEFTITAANMTGNPKTVSGQFVTWIANAPSSQTYTTSSFSTVHLVPSIDLTALPTPTAAPTIPPGVTATPTATTVATATPTAGPTSAPTAGPSPTPDPSTTGTAVPPTPTSPPPTATTAPTATAVPLQAPTGLTATNAGIKQIELQWDAVPGATSYQIDRTNYDGTHDTLLTSGTSYLDSGLHPNSTYSYRVRAVSGGSFSGWSAPASASS